MILLSKREVYLLSCKYYYHWPITNSFFVNLWIKQNAEVERVRARNGVPRGGIATKSEIEESNRNLVREYMVDSNLVLPASLREENILLPGEISSISASLRQEETSRRKREEEETNRVAAIIDQRQEEETIKQAAMNYKRQEEMKERRILEEASKAIIKREEELELQNALKESQLAIRPELISDIDSNFSSSESIKLKPVVTYTKKDKNKVKTYSETECVHCMDKKALVGMLCGHICLCKDCILLNEICPICQFMP